MKKIVVFIMLLFIPVMVHASSIENYTADDFFKEGHVGWNLGNSLDSHYGDWNGNANMQFETLWGNPKVTQELIDYVHAQGFNVIRIPVSWYLHTYKDDSGNFIIHEEWLNRVQEVVDYAYNRGMFIVLDTHHDDKVLYVGINDESEFNNVKKMANSLWSQIANRFKDYDEHLLFEAYNEIANKEAALEVSELSARQVNELNQIFTDAVRNTGSNNKYRLLIISPVFMGNSSEAIKSIVVPRDEVENRFILSVHMYSVLEDELLDIKFKQIKDDAASLGLKVIISEFGTTTSYSPVERRTVADSNFVARAYENDIISIRWDNGSNDFKIFDRSNLSASNQELIDAIVKPKKYSSTSNKNIINKVDQFYYKRLTSQGAFDEANLASWWGTWTNEELIEIGDN